MWPEDLEQAKAYIERLGVKEPDVYIESLALFARGAVCASEGHLLHTLSDEKLNGAQRRKKIDSCLQQAASWGEFARAPVKQQLHPTVRAHALACVLKP